MRPHLKGLRAALVADEGATAVEYAIIASLIAAVIAAVVGLLGLAVLDLFARAAGSW